MFVLGTAGHIDHGKSVLVHALTGIDPDRLREEKERGMTIDLGFAWFKLPGGREVGLVDVPGHERFVRNMLAGVGGIDLALLIIAANEGIMPQTREHLAILDILEVPRGIVVLTKKDLVDDELLSLVRMEVEELTENTVLAGAPALAVSALTGDGMPELVNAIDVMLSEAEPRRDSGRPRLPVDRVFTIAGAGTVVTGTLIDGSLAVGQEIEIVPSGIKSRVRGLQTHKAREDTATPCSRVAVNMVGLTTSQLHRGDVVTSPGWLKPTSMLSARIRLLDYLARPLKHNTTVSFHTGAAETMSKVRLLEGDELKPGESGWAQLVLEEPVAVINGDHFIVRSPMETLGGGRIADAHTRRLRRFRPEVISNLEAKDEGSAEDVVMALLETERKIEMTALLRGHNIKRDEIKPLLETLAQQGKVVKIGQADNPLLMTAGFWQGIREKALAELAGYHHKYPMRPGMPRVELTSKLKLGNYNAAALQKMTDEGDVVGEGAAVHLPQHSVSLSQSQQTKLDAFLKSLERNPYSPPADLIPEPDLLGLLIARGDVVKVSEGVVYAMPVYKEMVARLTAHIKSSGRVSLAETRDIFQTSRKYAQALLEHLDGEKVTRRVGDDRVLY
ncbi:selenocysteine-specific translation elongation factor [Chloroflexota bacterium]